MNFKVHDRTSIRVGSESYTYTIDVQDDCYVYTLGLIDCCNIFNKKVRDTLDLCEENGAYVSQSGRLFFLTKDIALNFVEFVEENLARI